MEAGAIVAEIRRLNLGAGGRCMAGPGWVNVDRIALPGIDVVHDLNVAPWPFAADSIGEVTAKDVFEHIDDAVTFLSECHRVMAPWSVLTLQTTLWQHISAYTDPTHKRFPTPHTLDYWIPGTVYYREHNAAYGNFAFARNSYFSDQRFGIQRWTLSKIPSVLTQEQRMQAAENIHSHAA